MIRTVFFAAVLVAQIAAPTAAPTPAPTATPVRTAPPNSALVRFSGQLIDDRDGYVYFSTGDAFALAPNAHVAGTPAPRTYARASFDPATGKIVELALAKRPFPPERAYEEIKKFAVAASKPVTNPELAPKRGLSGRTVAVTFVVQVPPATPLTDPVYMSTDESGWNPTALRLNRVDPLHYRLTLDLPTGTQWTYRYTRGSWRSVERAPNGLEVPPHKFLVGTTQYGEPDALRHDDVVVNWADINPASGNAAPPGPDAIPTPFNPSGPFVGLPTPPGRSLPPGPPPHAK